MEKENCVLACYYCNNDKSNIFEGREYKTFYSMGRNMHFKELLKQSDVISVHSNLSAETKGIFDESAFELMKPSSIFINTARGAIHHEEDLIAALQNRIIWGAGLDVTNPEPMKKDNPLLTMPTVAILPHIGSATVDARNGMAEIAAQNVIAGLEGKPLPFPVNPEIYDEE